MTDHDIRDSTADVPASFDRTQWAILIILTLSTFIVLDDASAVFIALPSILADLGGTLAQSTWILASFILSFAVFLLLFGKLGDIFGRRLMFVSGIGVFTLASLACAIAPSIEFLIGARVVLGIGAAMVEPTVLALIKSTFPREKLGLAFGVQGIAAGIGASLGPILGGFITTTLSWHYIFLLNVPIGIVAIVGALLTIRESRAEGISRTIDVPGLVTSGAGLFFLVFALVEGERLGWDSTTILGSFAAAIALLPLFVVIESRVRNPLVDLTLFKDRLFAVGNVLRGITEFGSLGVFFALSPFLQIVLGYSAFETGLVLLPLVAASIIVSPLAGSLSDRVDARWLVAPGFLLVAGGNFWLAHLSPETGWAFFITPLAVLGAGLATLYGPTTSTTLRDIPDELSGIASSVSYTAFLLGSELGVAVVSAVLQSQLTANVRDALAGTTLPAEEIDRISSSVSERTTSGQPAAQGGGPDAPQIQGLIDGAYADAVNTALLACVAAALLGTLASLFFSSRRKAGSATEENQRNNATIEPVSE